MGVAIPNMLSYLIHGNFHETVPGLDAFPEEDRPPVWIPFQTYHIMVAIGMFNIALTLFAGFMWWRGAIFRMRWLLWVFVFAVAGPYIANQFGWVAAEVGRQPWIVYGLLRTSEGLSEAVVAEQVAGSLLMFTLMYVLLLAVWLYVLNEKIQAGPEEPDWDAPGPDQPGFFAAAARRTDHTSGYSLTSAHDGQDGGTANGGGKEE